MPSHRTPRALRRRARFLPRSRVALFAGALAASAASACGDLPPPAIGELQLALSSGSGPSGFRLSRAEFLVTGAAELELASDDDSNADVLQRSLPGGEYQVFLLDGWQLVQTGSGGSGVVDATLISDNPLDFRIQPGELTTLTFQFETSAANLPLDDQGRLRLAIEVDGVIRPHVAFSEVMRNPAAVPDADGEWFELYNAGPRAVDLGGCSISRDDRSLELEGEFPIAAGDYLTFANGEAPGFSPDVVYGGITLPNSGDFTLRLECGDRVVDEVRFEHARLPSAPGRSLSLSGVLVDDVSNDRMESWCEAQTPYGSDSGTPGAPNPTCW